MEPEPSIAVAILTCDGKAYALHQFLRCLRQFVFPRERLHMLLVTDAARSAHALPLLREFVARYGYAATELPVTIPADTDRGTELNWKTRAQIAATMRQAALTAARALPVSHLFFPGCDQLFPADTLARLLRLDRPLATGVYAARVSGFPVVLSYNRADKSWAPLPYRATLYEADWCGCDCLLVRRDAFMRVDWQGFTTDAYNAGEDAWICHRTFEELGTRVSVDGNLLSPHITDRGVVMYPLRFYVDVIDILCPHCGSASAAYRPYRDSTRHCGRCGQGFPVLPYWEDIRFRLRDAVEQVPWKPN